MRSMYVFFLFGQVFSLFCMEVPALKSLAAQAILKDADLLKNAYVAKTDRRPLFFSEQQLLGYYTCIARKEKAWRILAQARDVEVLKGLQSAVFLPGTTTLAAVNRAGSLMLYDSVLDDYRSIDASSAVNVRKRRMNAVALSPDKKFLLTSSDDGRVVVRNIQALEKEEYVFHAEAPVYGAALSSDNAHILAGDAQGKAYVFDCKKGTRLLTLEHGDQPITHVSFSEDNKYVYTADTSIKKWNAVTGKCVTEFSYIHAIDSNISVLIPPTKKYAIASCENPLPAEDASRTTNYIISLGNKENAIRLAIDSYIQCAVWTRDESFLVAGLVDDAVICALKENKYEPVAHIGAFGSAEKPALLKVVKYCAINHEGSIIACGTSLGCLRIWSFKRLASCLTQEQAQFVLDLTDFLSPDNTLLQIPEFLRSSFDTLPQEVKGHIIQNFIIEWIK